VSQAVVARDLVKRFGRSTALRGIDFEVPVGSAFAVLGANGAGKSTLLRLVSGLARPSSGSLEVGGVPAAHPEARARVGYVGHATQLYPALTARENLLFAARLRGVEAGRERVAALLEQEALAAVADVPAGALSRGLAQRLSIARALVHAPDLLLLDEPFDGLDGPSCARLATRLRALRADRRTLLLVTHDARRAAGLCDAALVLARGQVAARAEGGLSADSLERALAEAA
jgi:ABC-type multidrug transport system ATPase subunit